MKKRFNLITRTDEPYCIEVSHDRREFCQKNRDYARLGTSTQVSAFPPGTTIETSWLYSESTQPDNSKDRRRYEQILRDTMDSLRDYKEV